MRYHEIIHGLDNFNHTHAKQIRKITEDEGLFYGQFPILACLVRNGNCTQKEIADYLQVSAPTVDRGVKRLERKGLVVKKSCDEDMRRTIIQVTEKGEKSAENCARRFFEFDDWLFSCLSEEEKQLFYDMLMRLSERMKEVREDD